MTTDSSLSEPNQHDDSPYATVVAGRSAEENDEISILDILIYLAERKRVILVVTAVFAILAIVYSLGLPISYTATVTLLPPQQSASMGSVLATQFGAMAALAGGGIGLKGPGDMYVAMFKSRTVEDAMVQHFGLMQEYHQKYLTDAKKVFESRSKVDATGRDGLIRISVTDGDPSRAAELANGYVDEFRSLSQHLAITEASQRRLFFERELEQAKDNLANAEEAMKQTEQTTGLIDSSSQARALLEAATSLRAQITMREVRIQGMQTYATGENAQLVQEQRELESLRAQLAKLGGSEDTASSGFIVSKGRVPEVGLEYIRKMRDVKYNETIFDILARQLEAAKLDEAKQGALIQVVDPAVPPEFKSPRHRVLIVFGATVVGFIFGVFVALLQVGIQRLKDDTEANQKLNILLRALLPNSLNR
jgi:uncharacterized protein involved in exopolysaccharide biosynthesis